MTDSSRQSFVRKICIVVFLFVHSFYCCFAGTWEIGSDEEITIFSEAKRRKTESLTMDIHHFQESVGYVFPSWKTDFKWPLSIIICKNKKSFRNFLSEEEEHNKKWAGFFLRGNDSDTIVVNADYRSDSLRPIIFHELAHRIIDENIDFVPLWLAEGYAQIHENFEIEKNLLVFGKKDEYQRRYFRRISMMPLDQLFHVSHDSAEYDHSNKASVFYVTSWAFVHFCLFNYHQSYKNELFSFVNDLKEKPATEELFQKHFGYSYQDMESMIRTHIFSNRYSLMHIPLENSLQYEIPTLKEADLFDEYVMFGSAFRRTGQYAKARNYLVSAESLLPQPIDDTHEDVTVQERAATVLSQLANLEYQVGNFKLSAEYAQKALRLGSENPQVHLIWCESKIEPLFQSENTDTRIEVSNRILERLDYIISLDSKHLRAHKLKLKALLISPIEIVDSQIDSVPHYCQLFPHDYRIHLLAADIYNVCGQQKKAVRLLQAYLEKTDNSFTKKIVEEALDQLRDAYSISML